MGDLKLGKILWEAVSTLDTCSRLLAMQHQAVPLAHG